MQYHDDEMRMFWTNALERHMIYRRKEQDDSPPPWTDDQIYRDYKFTATFRELDRGTKFVTNYIMQHHNLKPVDVIFNVLIYRLFNKIETFMYHDIQYTDKYDIEKFDKKVHRLDATDKVFTSAFIVSGYSMSELQGMDKIQRCARVIGWFRDQLLGDPNLVSDILGDTDMSITYKKIINLTGFGKFLAYQVAVDLSYWSKTQFGEDDFVVMGPGAIRGLDWLFPIQDADDDPRDGRNPAQCCEWLRDRQFELMSDYGLDCYTALSDRQVPYFTVMSIENLCCEFSKYMKAHTNAGRPRNRYNAVEGLERKKFFREVEDWNTQPYNIYTKPQNLVHYNRITNGTTD